MWKGPLAGLLLKKRYKSRPTILSLKSLDVDLLFYKVPDTVTELSFVTKVAIKLSKLVPPGTAVNISVPPMISILSQGAGY
jgi:hypothetical protein